MMTFILGAASLMPPLVSDWMNDHLRDPASARVEMTEEAHEATVNRKIYDTWPVREETYQAIVHCYRVNGKNAYGGFSGWTYYALIERNGRIYDLEDKPTSLCPATYAKLSG